MVPNYRLLASLFLLNIATSLYARKQTQPIDDNEGKKNEAASSPSTLSTEHDFIVHFDKLTKQNDFSKRENENDITEEDDDDKIWFISDDNIDKILNDTSYIGTDEQNNYELSNTEEETKKSPQLAEMTKTDGKENKKQKKSKENPRNSKNVLTTVEPEEMEIEKNIKNKTPTKSEIHSYNSVKKQESEVTITFSNDGSYNKKPNDVTSYKNKDSSENIALHKLLNLLLSNYVEGNKTNTVPWEMLAVLKEVQTVGESPVVPTNDSKSTTPNALGNNADKLIDFPQKRIETEDEINEKTIEETQAHPSGSKFIETTIIQNSNNYDSILPRNLLTVINTGNIENMQAIIPLGGHNLIFNDRTINPGIHFVTANVTSEEYMQTIAETISTLSFEKKTDLKKLGKKSKKRLVQALIKSIEEGMILIINSGSINGLNIKLPGTDPSTPKESTTEVTTEKEYVNYTAKNPGNKISTDYTYLETSTKIPRTETIYTNTDTDVNSENTYAGNVTSTDSNSEETTSTKNSVIEVTTQNTNAEVTTQTPNIDIASTEQDINIITLDQNSKGEVTKDVRIKFKGQTTTNTINIKSSSPNSNNVKRDQSESEVSTGHLILESDRKKPGEKYTIGTVIENSGHDSISIRPSARRNLNTNSLPYNQGDKMISEHSESESMEIKTTTEFKNTKTAIKFDKPTEVVIKTTDSEENMYHMNDNCNQSSEIFKENSLWHINHILPHNHNKDKRVYKNSHYGNTKCQICYKKSLCKIGYTETENNGISSNDRENTESENNGTDTTGHRAKRDIGSNFPMLGLLEHVNDGKKIKRLMSYLQLLLDFAENSKAEEENANQSVKREFYEEEDELAPLNTKI